ncbi:glycosyltransferase involved in cell wall biosynthesis [Brachybacterium muris]|uniref:glycosyltransferase n=1 Tax=Brachybacterium muris TaxID=219301 RepID=UPI001959983C|nr:glycosyltransferase [Brachybacterium muris]MBM7500876.1 glycosyltransferase involved in cell wall biosynthesis [Brachybacterium muris]
MRIALICHPHHPIREPWAGGMEMHTSMITAALLERGHQVTLYAKEGSEIPAGAKFAQIESSEHQYELNPDQQRGALQARRSEEAIRRACEMAASTDDDLVVNNSLSPLPHQLLSSCRLLTIMHSPVPVPAFVEFFARTSELPEQHRFVTVSESNAKAWREHYPEVGVLPNGIDIDYWSAAPETSTPTGESSTRADGPASRPHDGLRERPVALWTGRITHQKGLHIAIEAARLAEVDLRISGLRSDPGYFEEKIAPHLRKESEHDSTAPAYLGHLSHAEIREQLSAADVFIASPLWAEPFGLAPVEAMATGTPVAATPRGAMPEVIGDGGAVADSADPADLAEAIRRALHITPDAARSNAARYSLEAMARRFEQLVSEIH